ncbi:hypothetical protein, partial [Curvibacter delicatus]|uniref:hypothetical protein n=1 Tax=Curvibacter delicatus TaxID=80879 RepID=UPI001C3F9023
FFYPLPARSCNDANRGKQISHLSVNVRPYHRAAHPQRFFPRGAPLHRPHLDPAREKAARQRRTSKQAGLGLPRIHTIQIPLRFKIKPKKIKSLLNQIDMKFTSKIMTSTSPARASIGKNSSTQR